MFSHIMIGTNDLEKAKKFYDATLGVLGVSPAVVDGHRIFYRTPAGVFSVTKPIDGKPATHANGGTVGFAAASPELADKWHAAGLANGGVSIENPACARARPASSTSPICAIRTATRSARCTGCRRPEATPDREASASHVVREDCEPRGSRSFSLTCPCADRARRRGPARRLRRRPPTWRDRRAGRTRSTGSRSRWRSRNRRAR